MLERCAAAERAGARDSSEPAPGPARPAPLLPLSTLATLAQARTTGSTRWGNCEQDQVSPAKFGFGGGPGWDVEGNRATADQ